MRDLLIREVALSISEGASSIRALVFFVVILGVIPLATGPEPELLVRLGGGMIWIMALLSTLLSLDRLFQADLEDGTLVSLLTTASPEGPPPPLWQIVFSKCAVHWMITGVPVAVSAPLLGLWYGLPTQALWIAMLSLLAGTPALTAIGSIGAGLMAGVRRGGVLVTIVVMPLYVPILIFGTSAVEAASTQGAPLPMVQILIGLSLVSFVLGPWAATAALKIHLD